MFLYSGNGEVKGVYCKKFIFSIYLSLSLYISLSKNPRSHDIYHTALYNVNSLDKAITLRDWS